MSSVKTSPTTDFAIDPEERAYPSGALRHSQRRFWRARLVGTAQYVNGRAGVADSYWTCPAYAYYHGRRHYGYLTWTADSTDIIYIFQPRKG
jgi:hypothetical protein